MAKVAFDVQGTLKGRHSAKIVQFFKFLEARGHTMYIWSFGGYSMAKAAADTFGLTPEDCMDKVLTDYYGEGYTMDACVDDERNCGLSAAKEINVQEVPEDPSELDEFAKKYGL